MSASTCKIVFLRPKTLPGLPEWLGPSQFLAVAFVGKVRPLTGSNSVAQSDNQDDKFSSTQLGVALQQQITEGRLLFAQRYLSPKETQSPERVTELSQSLVEELSAKVGKHSTVLAALVEGPPPFADFKIRDKPFISMPATLETSELRLARQVAHWLGQEMLRNLAWEYPMIDFHQVTEPSFAKMLESFPVDHLVRWDHPSAHTLSELHFRKKKLLLHVCCGPDAAGVIEQLKKDFDLLLFWYDPNIQPEEEYQKRLKAFKKVAEIEEVPFVEGEYDVQNFYQRIKGLEHTPEQGAKCSHCYDMRLERAAVEAKAQNCDLYTTTLAISPHKVQEKLRAFGLLNEKTYGVPYWAKNFLKDDGFKDSVEYSTTHNIYRQDYCGCYFSLFEGGPQARQNAERLGFTAEHLKSGFKNPYLTSPQPKLLRGEPS